MVHLCSCIGKNTLARVVCSNGFDDGCVLACISLVAVISCFCMSTPPGIRRCQRFALRVGICCALPVFCVV